MSDEVINKVFSIPSHVTWKSLQSGFVLLDLNSGNYFTLNETASAIWRGIMEGKPEQQIVADFCAEYDCSEVQAAQDIREQIEFLVQENLLAQDVPDAPCKSI